MKPNLDLQDRIIVALDTQKKDELDQLILALKGRASFVKIGMELFYTFGPSLIKELKEAGFKIFLDLKVHDIPNTAKRSIKTLCQLGVDILNVHAAGGIQMMSMAKEGIDEAITENPKLSRPKLIAVTQLTSTDQNMLNTELLIPTELEEVVTTYAQNAFNAGLDGVVASAHEVRRIKAIINSEFLCVTPGIRMPEDDSHDQKRIMTPKLAIDTGSDYLVIGRSITKDSNPQLAFEKILSTLKE